MVNSFADRVRVLTSTVGVGTVTLGSAVAGFRTFQQAVTDGSLVSGATIYYCIEDGNAWEVGSGVYTAPTSLTRTVIASSLGSATHLTLSGNAQVYITFSATAAATANITSGSIDNTAIGMNTPANGQFIGSPIVPFYVEGGTWINSQNAVWTGSEIDYASQLWNVGLHTGTSTAPVVRLTEFTVQEDQLRIGGGGIFVNGFNFLHNFGGGNAAGNRQGMFVLLNQQAATTSHSFLGENPFYTAGQFLFQSGFNEGGTGHVYAGGVDPSVGQGFALGAQARLTPGGTNWTSVAGMEINVAIQAGASARSKSGLTIVKTSDDAVQGGDGEDCAIGIADAVGSAAYWDCGLSFGSAEAQWPFKVSSSLIKVYPQNFGAPLLCDTGIDFSNIHFQTSAFKSIGCNIDPSGVLQMANEIDIANFRMTGTATGMAILNDGIFTSWVFTIASGGTGYIVNDILTTANGGVYIVDTTNDGVVTTVTQVVADISRSPPSNPVATTNLTTTRFTTGGSGCTINFTWSAQNRLDINPSHLTTIGAEASGTRIVTDAGDVFCNDQDNFVVVNRGTSITANVWLPATPLAGRIITVKDGKGDGATANLLIKADNSPTETIDGAASYTMNRNYGCVVVRANGTEWNIVSAY